MRFRRLVALVDLAASAALSCSPAARPASTTEKTLETASPPVAAAGNDAPGAAVAPPATPTNAGGAVGAAGSRKLTADEARRYMVQLINRDRATQGLAPVELDLGPPTISGQGHADDMASRGYLGHWGADGSVPEQRLTEAGGVDMVLENALCFVDEHPRTLDANARIDAAEVERAESMFWNEVPPNDGHRKNIMRPGHRKVGIGVAQPVLTATEIPVPCFAQEFTDPYGTYAPVPRAAKVGQMLHVEGTIDAPATMGGVGLARVVSPKPIAVSELNTRRSYPVPAPFQMYWPTGYKTPIPVGVHGRAFSIDVPLDDKGQPGLYEVSVWGKLPGSADFVMLGLRTIVVTK